MTNQLITHRSLIDYQLMSLMIDYLCLVYTVIRQITIITTYELKPPKHWWPP